MTTARDIVSEALREGGILALGETLEAASLTEGLSRLNTLIRGLLGIELGENLKVYNIGANGLETPEAIDADISYYVSTSYVPSNTFLHANLEQDGIVYLNPTPDDGARLAVLDLSNNFATNNLTLDANGKLIEGSATLTLSTNGAKTEWFYRADQGNWVKVLDLEASDPIPFPEEFSELLINGLALRLVHLYGQEVRPETVAAYQSAKSRFRARYLQTKEVMSDIGLQKMTWRKETDFDFERGRIWNY